MWNHETLTQIPLTAISICAVISNTPFYDTWKVVTSLNITSVKCLPQDFYRCRKCEKQSRSKLLPVGNKNETKPHSLFILSNLRQIHCPSRIWSSFKVILGKKVRRKKYCPVWLLMGYLILFAYLVGNGNPNHKKAHGYLLFTWNAVNKARKKVFEIMMTEKKNSMANICTAFDVQVFLLVQTLSL